MSPYDDWTAAYAEDISRQGYVKGLDNRVTLVRDRLSPELLPGMFLLLWWPEHRKGQRP